MRHLRSGMQVLMAVRHESGVLQNHAARCQAVASLIQARGYADCGAKEGKKKTMTICQSPPNEPKVIPPYEYGYCREPDPEPPTGCPVKKKEEKREKTGPCCKSTKKQGGCKN